MNVHSLHRAGPALLEQTQEPLQLCQRESTQLAAAAASEKIAVDLCRGSVFPNNFNHKLVREQIAKFHKKG